MARAVADAARQSPDLASVRSLVAGVVQREACDIAELADELQAGARHGSRWLRRAMLDVGAGARSAAEARAADQLRALAMPHFELNVPLHDRAGRLVAVADVLWRELRAVLEIDSREYHFAESEWKATMRRHNRLTKGGLAVTHYPPSAVNQRGRRWALEVVDWLRTRAAELGLPYVAGGGRPSEAERPFVID